MKPGVAKTNVVRTIIPEPWSDLRIILVVAQQRGIKRAAGALGMTEGTVSRHVTAVERRLGLTLFERTPTGMVPTPACLVLTDRLTRAEAEIEAGVEAALDTHDEPIGTVRLTTVPILLNRILLPAASNLTMRYPHLVLDLVASPADLSMMRREADMAVRLSRPSSELDALASRLARLDYGVFAPRGVEDAGGYGNELAWITYDHTMSKLPHVAWITARVEEHGELLAPVRCNDAEGIIGAIRAGFGKSLLPRRIGATLPDLAELPNYKDLPFREVWLLLHPNLVMTGRVRVVVDWLRVLLGTRNPR